MKHTAKILLYLAMAAVAYGTAGDIEISERTSTNQRVNNKLVPSADGLLGVDDSNSDGSKVEIISIGSGLAFSGTALSVDTSGILPDVLTLTDSTTLTNDHNGAVIYLNKGTAATQQIPAGLATGHTFTVYNIGAGAWTFEDAAVTLKDLSGSTLTSYILDQYDSVSFFHLGSNVWYAWSMGIKNNLTATTSPGVNDDETLGYAPGSLWWDLTGEALWTCFDATDGAASWVDLTAGGAGDALTSNPLSQFAATTSEQLRGVLSDESGTGVILTANGNGSSLTGVVAATGDSATSFFSTGTLENARLDADLQIWAGITPSANAQSLVGAANYAAMRTLLDLESGTDFNAYDADLTIWAGITPSTNVGTALATPSSANLRAAVTDESGTGVLIFAGGDIGAATATTPSANDNDTSVATTAFVHSDSLMAVNTKSGTYTIGTDDAKEVERGFVTVTAATTITGPATLVVGGYFTIKANVAGTVVFDPNGSHTITLDGLALSAGDSVSSNGTAGELITFVATSSTTLDASSDGWVDTN